MRMIGWLGGVALAWAVTAAAQDAGPSEAEVRAFLEPLGPRAEAAAAAGDWRGVAGWMRDHLAADATVALSGTLVAAGGTSVSYDVATDGANLEQVAELTMAGAEPPAQPGEIANYSLSLEVAEVEAWPAGAAGARVDVHERGMMDVADPDGGDGTTRVAFDSVGSCALRLAEAGAGRLVITLADCRVSTTM